MIKKLRNKMLMMNMISTFCLIILAFTAIYAIIYSNVETEIQQSLLRTFSFHPAMRMHRPMEDMRPNGEGAEQFPPHRDLSDLRNFSVFVEKDGTIRTDSLLGENSAHYENVANVALSQNSSSGEFKSEDIVWRFMTREGREGEKIIALVDISAEKNLLKQLIMSFSVGAAVLLIMIYIISLHFANRAIKPLREAWNKQKQFVADASHELKTPLAAINTNIDAVLSQKEKTIESGEKWLQYVKKEVQRLSELTGNLLFMAKMDGDVHIEKNIACLSEIAESAVLNLEAVAFEKGVTLDYDIEKDIFAKVNGAQMTQLGLILLDNAIKYSPEGEAVHIKLCKNSREQAVFSVHNMGEAIPREDIGKIFDRFYRVDKSRSTSGYGLGLAMAKEIVQAHRGKISVKSSQQDGTEFTVVLPL